MNPSADDVDVIRCVFILCIFGGTSIIRITVITYNLNKQLAANDANVQLNNLFTDEDRANDIIFVALQESPMSFDVWQQNAWAEQFTETLLLNDFVQYQPSTSLRLLGTHSLIYLKRRLLGTVLAIDVKTYYHTFMDLKATVGVSLRFAYDTRLTLVNTHMTATRELLSTRIREYHTLRTTMQFCSDAKYISDDILIMAGDFNSRTESSEAQNFANIAERIRTEFNDKEHALKTILNSDQLTLCRRAREMAVELQEAPITFAPTYRMLVGTEKYDIARVPSYCDRVLYSCNEIVGHHPGRSANKLHIQCTSYECVYGVTFSDHLPVRARFEAQLPSVCLRPHWCVIFAIDEFTQLTAYSSDVDIKFVVTNADYVLSALDWIGIYEEPLLCDATPTAYRYCAPAWRADPNASASSQNVATSTQSIVWYLNTGPQMLARKPGRFRFGYYSRAKNVLIGVSNAFELITGEVEAAKEA